MRQAAPRAAPHRRAVIRKGPLVPLHLSLHHQHQQRYLARRYCQSILDTGLVSEPQCAAAAVLDADPASRHYRWHSRPHQRHRCC